MCDDLGVMHGSQHGAREEDREEDREPRRELEGPSDRDHHGTGQWQDHGSVAQPVGDAVGRALGRDGRLGFHDCAILDVRAFSCPGRALASSSEGVWGRHPR
jgi:hypothetical protein